MVYIWSDHESVDELKHKLLCTNFELESAKMMAKEEVSKNDEIITQLVQLFKIACQERDEARNQLQKILNEFLPSQDQNPTAILSQAPNEIPSPQKPTNPEIIKEPEILPQTFNFHVYGAFQGMHNPNFAADSMSNNLALSKKRGFEECVPKIDYPSAVIDNIARVRPLPKKGRLMQAVMETGPLLQTLLVAPLPKWKNPPPLPPFQNSPPLIYGSEEVVDSIRATQCSSSGSVVSFLDASSPGFSHIPSSSVLSFALGSACLSNGMEFQVGNNNVESMRYQIATGKRLRF